MKKTVLKEKTLNSIDFIDMASNKIATTGEIIKEIPIDKIKIKDNVRKIYNEEKITEMAKSIKEVGQIQPITVIKAENNFYEIIIGHQRYKAVVSLNQENPENYLKIKCIVKNIDDFNKDEIKEIQIIENIQRENLSVLDLKDSLSYFKNKGLTHKQIGEKLCKSEGYVRNIFSNINELNNNPELDQFVKHHVDVTSSDLQTVKVLPFKQQIELLKRKLKGEIKSIKELRNIVWEIKNDNYDISHENHLKKKNYDDIVKIKSDGVIKVKTFDYRPGITTEEQKEKLLNMLKTLINKLENKTELTQ